MDIYLLPWERAFAFLGRGTNWTQVIRGLFGDTVGVLITTIFGACFVRGGRVAMIGAVLELGRGLMGAGENSGVGESERALSALSIWVSGVEMVVLSASRTPQDIVSKVCSWVAAGGGVGLAMPLPDAVSAFSIVSKLKKMRRYTYSNR
jgi:hypothetical protein